MYQILVASLSLCWATAQILTSSVVDVFYFVYNAYGTTDTWIYWHTGKELEASCSLTSPLTKNFLPYWLRDYPLMSPLLSQSKLTFTHLGWPFCRKVERTTVYTTSMEPRGGWLITWYTNVNNTLTWFSVPHARHSYLSENRLAIARNQFAPAFYISLFANCFENRDCTLMRGIQCCFCAIRSCSLT